MGVTNFNPKVSIIIPVYMGPNYQHPDYLRQAIDSALGQTYRNIEVIVVNDGSNDGGKAEEIAKSYGDRIRYFYKENGGVASALNMGIREMTGEYFSWLSHDDVFYPDKVEKQIKFMRENPGVEIVASNFEIIDNRSNVVGVTDIPSSIKRARDFLISQVSWCTLLAHRPVLAKTGFFNEQNKTTQDTEMILKILFYHPIFVIPRVLSQCRTHEESVTFTQSHQNFKDIEYLLNKMLKEYPLDFFSANNHTATLRLKDKAEIYEWAGDYAKRYGLFKATAKNYMHSLLYYPFPCNASLLKFLLSPYILVKKKAIRLLQVSAVSFVIRILRKAAGKRL